MPNDVLSAFIQQTYGSPQKAIDADKQANQRENNAKEFAENAHKKAVAQISRNQNISSAMNIPSRLKEGQLNQKTIPHPQMKNYDHSLEMRRDIGLREKILDEKYKDNPEERPSADIDFKELSTGSVEDMFNNMFSNDD